jgi:hypothetical protein
VSGINVHTMEDFNEILTCAVCLDFFKSRRLPCHHVYCVQCLQGIVNKDFLVELEWFSYTIVHGELISFCLYGIKNCAQFMIHFRSFVSIIF